MLVFGFVAIAVLTVGLISSGAFWTAPTHVNANTIVAGTFDIDVSDTLGGTGSDTVTGIFSAPPNWEPGDNPITGVVYFHNNGTADANIVYSGFTLSESDHLSEFICVIAISDSTGTTSLTDFAGAHPGGSDGNCLTLKEISAYLAAGYFSNGGNTHNIYIPAGGNAWISMTLGFKSAAPDSTQGDSLSFDWLLTAEQVPVNDIH